MSHLAPDRWQSLMDSLGAKSQVPWDGLIAAYRELHRAYHNDRHIADCLKQLDDFCRQSQTMPEVEAALWFHDVIYDPKRNDNEEQSAKAMQRLLVPAGIAEEALDRISALILATRHNQPPQTLEEKLIVDIDLSILGQPPEEFELYDQAIRLEYGWVPEEDYRRGRAKVLRRFLDQKPLYHLDFFRERYEKQARENLEKKISEIEPLMSE